MAKVLITEQYLEDIADAIRAKHGTEATYTPALMATAITNIPTGGGGGDLPEEAFVVTGSCQYRFANGGWDWFIEEYGDRVTTKDIQYSTNMFSLTKVKTIPFELNLSNSKLISIDNMFSYSAIEEPPKINSFKANSRTKLFEECNYLRYIPDDYADNWDFSQLEKPTSGYNGSCEGMFTGCYSLRKLPRSLLEHANPLAVPNCSMYRYLANNCHSLDEIIDLPLVHGETWTSNGFNYMVDNCFRLKNLTFSGSYKYYGTGYGMKGQWKNQTIDLSKFVGYGDGYSTSRIWLYNSGITEDKEVKDDATYQALKNDPDWFTRDINYSRYNHDSAVATINSLPNCSSYLATAGGTNTIKFKGASGALTDGGAINTLTEEEIAVATAKGWTVSFT